MAKIASFSIQGRILRWLESYLCGRSQQVYISCQLSHPERVWSGVPQGSILWPLLFLMYVNDIGAIPNTSLYADDTTLLASHGVAPRRVSRPAGRNRLCGQVDAKVETPAELRQDRGHVCRPQRVIRCCTSPNFYFPFPR